jgi:hypothetical protein
VNSNFEPIIGDSFSDIGRQRFAYAGFNANIENQNMARAAQAQQEQNRWLLVLAQMQRQDAAEAAHQDALDHSAYDSSVGRQDKLNVDAEHRREFDVSSEIQREAEKEKNDYLKWHYQIADKEKKVDLDSIEATANYMAPQASEAVKNLQKAGKDLDETQRELNNAGNDAMSNLKTKGRYTYDTKSGTLVPVVRGSPVLPEDVEALTSADKQIADKRSAFLAAKRSHDEAVQYLRSIRTQAGQYGLITGDDGKLFSPKHQKAFGDGAGSATSVPAPADTGEPGTFSGAFWNSINQPSPIPGVSPDGAGAPAWSGFNPQTVTATNAPDFVAASGQETNAPPSVPQPIRVGRFIVTPR